jgi:hypothetical protein
MSWLSAPPSQADMLATIKWLPTRHPGTDYEAWKDWFVQHMELPIAAQPTQPAQPEQEEEEYEILAEEPLYLDGELQEMRASENQAEDEGRVEIEYQHQIQKNPVCRLRRMEQEDRERVHEIHQMLNQMQYENQTQEPLDLQQMKQVIQATEEGICQVDFNIKILGHAYSPDKQEYMHLRLHWVKQGLQAKKDWVRQMEGELRQIEWENALQEQAEFEAFQQLEIAKEIANLYFDKLELFIALEDDTIFFPADGVREEEEPEPEQKLPDLTVYRGILEAASKKQEIERIQKDMEQRKPWYEQHNQDLRRRWEEERNVALLRSTLRSIVDSDISLGERRLAQSPSTGPCSGKHTPCELAEVEQPAEKTRTSWIY